METTLIQSESEITMGQRVDSRAFGDGTVAGIDGDVITVRFEDGEERKLKAEYLTTSLQFITHLQARTEQAPFACIWGTPVS
jgi:hypothetical protein